MQPEFQSCDMAELLRACGEGDKEALDRIAPLVYRELHRLAHAYMAREHPGHTLQTTALVNETYLRMVGARELAWTGRAHFFAICARMMRRILTDFARARKYHKRGGGQEPVSLEESLVVAQRPGTEIVAIDDALTRLAAVDPRKSQVVELRFFGGLTVQETAEVLKISPETVMRDWKMAKAWLYRDLSGKNPDGA
jgi:RNA polymerase sigma factor (TIGR02999 family)